jgi:hypothetical protein
MLEQIEARNPGAEAQSMLGPDARLHEPSPPAVTEPPWFADRRALVLELFEGARDELSDA